MYRQNDDEIIIRHHASLLFIIIIIKLLLLLTVVFLSLLFCGRVRRKEKKVERLFTNSFFWLFILEI